MGACFGLTVVLQIEEFGEMVNAGNGCLSAKLDGGRKVIFFRLGLDYPISVYKFIKSQHIVCYARAGLERARSFVISNFGS